MNAFFSREPCFAKNMAWLTRPRRNRYINQYLLMAFVVAIILFSTTDTSFVSIFSWRSPLSFRPDRDVGGSSGPALQPQPCLSVPQHEETAVVRRPPSPQKPLAPPSKTVKPLGWHKYLPNGMLEMNPDGAHPILELIKTAEDKWQKKLERASRTLEEAVVEYKRRYKRAPPKGFDDWYISSPLPRIAMYGLTWK